ncbi:hypothetical protein ACFL6S_33290 [Candidatus Poribacteria bacterium]
MAAERLAMTNEDNGEFDGDLRLELARARYDIYDNIYRDHRFI